MMVLVLAHEPFNLLGPIDAGRARLAGTYVRANTSIVPSMKVAVEPLRKRFPGCWPPVFLSFLITVRLSPY